MRQKCVARGESLAGLGRCSGDHGTDDSIINEDVPLHL